VQDEVRRPRLGQRCTQGWSTPWDKPWTNPRPTPRARQVGKLAFDFSEGLVVGLGLPPGPERETLRLKWAEFSDNVFTYTVRAPSRRARGTGARTLTGSWRQHSAASSARMRSLCSLLFRWAHKGRIAAHANSSPPAQYASIVPADFATNASLLSTQVIATAAHAAAPRAPRSWTCRARPSTRQRRPRRSSCGALRRAWPPSATRCWRRALPRRARRCWSTTWARASPTAMTWTRTSCRRGPLHTLTNPNHCFCYCVVCCWGLRDAAGSLACWDRTCRAVGAGSEARARARHKHSAERVICMRRGSL